MPNYLSHDFYIEFGVILQEIVKQRWSRFLNYSIHNCISSLKTIPSMNGTMNIDYLQFCIDRADQRIGSYKLSVDHIKKRISIINIPKRLKDLLSNRIFFFLVGLIGQQIFKYH
jgi:hypothetical protein